MRGTKLTETRVNILLVPPLLTMETSIILGTTGSLYTSVQQTVALSTSLLHNPSPAPLPSPSCSGCVQQGALALFSWYGLLTAHLPTEALPHPRLLQTL